jgi:hypothetical protein
MGVTTRAVAKVAVAMERWMRRVDIMMFTCPLNFVLSGVAVVRPEFEESKAEFQPGQFALVKCSVD